MNDSTRCCSVTFEMTQYESLLRSVHARYINLAKEESRCLHHLTPILP